MEIPTDSCHLFCTSGNPCAIPNSHSWGRRSQLAPRGLGTRQVLKSTLCEGGLVAAGWVRWEWAVAESLHPLHNVANWRSYLQAVRILPFAHFESFLGSLVLPMASRNPCLCHKSQQKKKTSFWSGVKRSRRNVQFSAGPLKTLPLCLSYSNAIRKNDPFRVQKVHSFPYKSATLPRCA